ncbi:MAG: BMP family ABC transporter substrate-binding protein [Lachnospiraceae bacterium]|nr:BMP family ABC transporter substrate-binding protein [Lachnospiraceae bacterium]
MKIKWSSTRVLLIIVSAILIAAVIGMLLIRDTAVDTDITAHTTAIGLILPGVKDDANYSQAHFDALMSIKDELNLKILCKDRTPEDNSCLEIMRELIEKEGCKMIIAASFGYGKYVKELADLYPDICFIHPTGTESLPNLTNCMGRMYQARYLAGIVAGMRTETGEIGYVAAFSIPEVICQINAFTLGANRVAPGTKVHVRYVNSWTDDAAAKDASEALLAQYPEIDILTMHTNSLMPNLVAEEKGIWSIGFNKDNAERYPESYLTACVWEWADFYKAEITDCLQGKFHGSSKLIGMEDGIVGLSDLTENCAPGTKEAVDEAIRLFESRTFDVFYGPITDNTGTLRVPDRESLSDEEICSTFNWYVEGVIVEE